MSTYYIQFKEAVYTPSDVFKPLFSGDEYFLRAIDGLVKANRPAILLTRDSGVETGPDIDPEGMLFLPDENLDAMLTRLAAFYPEGWLTVVPLANLETLKAINDDPDLTTAFLMWADGIGIGEREKRLREGGVN